jgi:PilZ domain
VPIALPVFLESAGAQLSARLANLSQSGALVESSASIPAGSHVLFNCGSIKSHGVVVWKNERQCGIRFSSQIEEGRMAQQVERAHAAERARELLRGAARVA